MKRMMLLSSILMLAAVLVIPATGAGDEQGMPPKMPPADGAALWKHFTEESPYLGWGVWPGFEEPVEGKSPHGAFVRVLANPIALEAARAGLEVLPAGSIIMKENFDKDGKLVALTPMYRVAGFDPEGGDWFWVQYGADGTIGAEGKVKGCAECHARVQKRDWRFLPFKK